MDTTWLDERLIELAELYAEFGADGRARLAAEAVRIRPERFVEQAAELAGEERDSLNRCGRNLLLGFPHSAHLVSIKQGR